MKKAIRASGFELISEFGFSNTTNMASDLYNYEHYFTYFVA